QLLRQEVVLPGWAKHHLLQPRDIGIEARERRAQQRLSLGVAVRDVTDVVGRHRQPHALDLPRPATRSRQARIRAPISAGGDISNVIIATPAMALLAARPSRFSSNSSHAASSPAAICSSTRAGIVTPTRFSMRSAA